MISVEEALEKILENVRVLGPIKKPIIHCLGQVLAEDAFSDVTIPPLDIFKALLDGSGDDLYTAGNWSMGTGYWFGMGTLHDGGGDDPPTVSGGW